MPAPTATPTVTAVQKIIPLPLPLPRPHRKGLHCQGLLPAPATHGGSGGPAPQLLDAALDENVWECNEEFLLLGSGSESDTATTATTATAVGSNSSCCLSMPFVRGHGTQLGWRILELHKAYLEAQAQRAQHHDTGSTAKGYSPRHRAAHVQLLGRHRPERENICRLRGSANLNGKHLLFGSRPSHLPYAQVELADDGMRLNPFYTKLIHASCQCKHWRNF